MSDIGIKINDHLLTESKPVIMLSELMLKDIRILLQWGKSCFHFKH